VQVSPTSVAGVREKPNLAVKTKNGAIPKLWMRLKNEVQLHLILLNNRPGAIILVPIWPKREELLGSYGKKARLSVMMRIRFTPSSYPIDANASRGRARFFCELTATLKTLSAKALHYRLIAECAFPAQSTRTP
jgi:hypothetical protein